MLPPGIESGWEPPGYLIVDATGALDANNSKDLQHVFAELQEVRCPGEIGGEGGGGGTCGQHPGTRWSGGGQFWTTCCPTSQPTASHTPPVLASAAGTRVLPSTEYIACMIDSIMHAIYSDQRDFARHISVEVTSPWSSSITSQPLNNESLLSVWRGGRGSQT